MTLSAPQSPRGSPRRTASRLRPRLLSQLLPQLLLATSGRLADQNIHTHTATDNHCPFTTRNSNHRHKLFPYECNASRNEPIRLERIRPNLYLGQLYQETPLFS